MILKNTPIIFPKNIKLVSLKNPGSSKNKSIFSAKLKHFESQNEKSIAPAQSFVHPKMKNPTINLFSLLFYKRSYHYSNIPFLSFPSFERNMPPRPPCASGSLNKELLYITIIFTVFPVATSAFSAKSAIAQHSYFIAKLSRISRIFLLSYSHSALLFPLGNCVNSSTDLSLHCPDSTIFRMSAGVGQYGDFLRQILSAQRNSSSVMRSRSSHHKLANASCSSLLRSG